MAIVSTDSVDGTTENKHPMSSSHRCLNLSFIKTPLGILQLVVTVINVICIGIMGDVITMKVPNQSYWLIVGASYMTFFVMLAFMCLIITILIVLTSVTSSNTFALLPKTTFFVAYHVLATVFYLCTSIAVISEVAKSSELHILRPSTNVVTGNMELHSVRGQVLAAGSFGIFATVVYAALTVLAFYHFLRS